jgi:hypothetical protein
MPFHGVGYLFNFRVHLLVPFFARQIEKEKDESTKKIALKVKALCSIFYIYSALLILVIAVLTQLNK